MLGGWFLKVTITPPPYERDLLSEEPAESFPDPYGQLFNQYVYYKVSCENPKGFDWKRLHVAQHLESSGVKEAMETPSIFPHTTPYESQPSECSEL